VRLAALTQLLRLRQICCDPRLVGGKGDGPPDAESKPYAGSAKLESFREILEEATDGGHRLLVFSQFTSLLSLLREELRSQGIEPLLPRRLHGAAARQVEIDRFQASPDTPVFLLSLKAGGSGSTSRPRTRSSISTRGGTRRRGAGDRPGPPDRPDPGRHELQARLPGTVEEKVLASRRRSGRSWPAFSRRATPRLRR
jgi:hypothetical protein